MVSALDFASKHVLVLGLGKSGKAVSLALKKLGADVLASDTATSVAVQDIADELSKAGVKVVLGNQGEKLLDNVDAVVVSPGVPSNVLVLETAKRRGIPVLSEIEFAYNLTDVPVIAISGTNGKTTTTTLIGEVFKNAGKAATVAGNIGTPLVGAVDNKDIETLIVEVSSFQLDTINEFRPKISVLLNVTEDHLDWHPDFEDYMRAKARLFMNQQSDDFAVVNIDDPVVARLVSDIRATVIATSKFTKPECGVFIKDGRITVRLGDDIDTDICGTEELKILGSHNLDNVMAVAGACCAAGISPKVIRDTVIAFGGLKHRIEYVATVDGVRYYDDSKATNVDATIKALTAFKEPTILLVGGRNKGNSFKPLAQSIHSNVQAIIGFGEAGREIVGKMPDFTARQYAETVDGAAKLAFERAKSGWIVLFSPACASFDAFSGYAERGDAFQRVVTALGEGNDIEQS